MWSCCKWRVGIHLMNSSTVSLDQCSMAVFQSWALKRIVVNRCVRFVHMCMWIHVALYPLAQTADPADAISVLAKCVTTPISSHPSTPYPLILVPSSHPSTPPHPLILVLLPIFSYPSVPLSANSLLKAELTMKHSVPVPAKKPALLRGGWTVQHYLELYWAEDTLVLCVYVLHETISLTTSWFQKYICFHFQWLDVNFS